MRLSATIPAALLLSSTTRAWSSDYISVTGNDTAPYFSLGNSQISYQFHVDSNSNDLIHDHFGGPAAEATPPQTQFSGGWSTPMTDSRREFPDLGRGDYRLPAIHVQHAEGDTVSAFQYQHYTIEDGKSPLPGLPATYGDSNAVSTLTIHLWDNYSSVAADLRYSIFHNYAAVTRSFNITNWSKTNVTVQRAASWSIDMPNEEYQMLEFHGDWSHERQRISRPVQYGIQGFRSSAGYSSHYYTPAYALTSPWTSETNGAAYGFNLVYTGSFSADVERFSHGFVRVLLGLNPLQMSEELGPGQSLTTPEVVGVYSDQGVNGMSMIYHNLFRQHLSRSNHTMETRPVLLNSWEGFGFDFNDTSLEYLARETAGLGIRLFVMDDGWFGTDYPRNNDSEGLGDWTPNPMRFPNGLNPFVQNVNSNTINGTSDKQLFGLWVEPEMVDPKSDLYNAHPDWALHAGSHTRTLTRNQLVLNLARSDVQDYVIDAISKVLDSADIRYIKWDNNRGINEMPSPSTDYAYVLGIYHVIDTLTTKYPQVLFEGCASGGGRFDAGLLHYWPQHWASDNTDGIDRLYIQFGTSVFFPPSAMACHVSAVPNGETGRNTSITFRAHVAMMCGSFGFELDPAKLPPADLAMVPDIVKEAEKINPIVISGQFYRLRLPEASNWPAVQFVSQDNSTSVVLAYQIRNAVKPVPPPLRMQGLDPNAKYSIQNKQINGTFTGNTLMNSGFNLHFSGDADSQLIWLYKQ